jgi:misacylated tRNA(Ala) deacylase
MALIRRHLEHHPGINPAPFKAIVESVTDEGVILSDSWCYPKGGGQPGDTGIFLSDGEEFRFGEVSASSHIIHPVSGDILQVGQEVDCVIDVERRNALTSMHSAAHIVSATANERWGAITVGNQLGESESRMDLKFENRDDFDVNMLEEDANHWVNKDAEIKIHEWSRKQIMSDDRVRNRRFVERIIDRIGGSDPILRMVEIEGIDLCPCAGTHLSSTSSIGNITIGRVQNKGKGTFRIYFEI